jgi:hypothetical protein
MRWYTALSPAEWSPEKKGAYNDFFTDMIRGTRAAFYLEKVHAGLEANPSGKWRPFNVQGKEALAIVDRFEWMNFDSDDGIYFDMKLRVAVKETNVIQMLFGRTSTTKIIFDEVVRINFDEEFPISPPLFRVISSHYRNITDMHGHHLFSNGTLCILADRKDWNPEKEHILRAVNAAIDWIVWHYETWGTDPRRW